MTTHHIVKPDQEMTWSTTYSAQDSQQLAGTRWRLDPSGSSAGFRVPNFWGLTSDTGRFQRLDGWLEVDDDQGWRMELTLDAASLDTGNARRDRHLLSADFFDVEHHPEVRFRSSSVNHDDGDGRPATAGHDLQPAGRDQDPDRPQRPRAPGEDPISRDETEGARLWLRRHNEY